MSRSGEITFQLSMVVDILGEKMYSSSLVFVRENVQNAVDATRILAKRQGNSVGSTLIEVRITPDYIEVEDWGVGMTEADIRTYYWNLGKSSKQTAEAKEAGCIGQFGIGGFANFGVCSEVHLYTKATDRKDSEVYSVVRKKDLEADKSDYPIQASSKLNHQGTLIHCLPLKGKFDVDSIASYLEKYVQYLPEPIKLNGKLISQNIFLQEELNPITKEHKRYKLKQGSIEGVILEDSSKVSFRPKKGKVNGEHYILNGEVEISNKELYIYKNSFLMAEYTYPYNNVILSGNLDFPFVKPNASRESLDNESQRIIQDFCKVTIEILVNYIAKRPELFNNHVNNLIGFIYRRDEIELLENLTVSLLNSQELTLKDLKQKAKDPKIDFYFLTGKPSGPHRTLQNRGAMVVLISSYGYQLRDLVKRFLMKYCKAIEAPTVIPKNLFKQQELHPNEQYVISMIKSSLDKQQCSELKVEACHLDPDNIPMMLEDAEMSLYINIEHDDFKKLTDYTDHRTFDTLVDSFIRDNIEDGLARHRKKIFGKGGKGLDALFSIQDRYQVILERLEELNLIKRVKSPWKGPTEPLIQIESDDFPNMQGCYLRLPEPLVDAYKGHLGREHNMEIVAFSKRVIFVIYFEMDSSLLIEIELDRPVFFEKQGKNERTISTKDVRHILPYPQVNSIYLPIPSELESSFNPQGITREITIGAKLEEY